jgi:hypothetical protein
LTPTINVLDTSRENCFELERFNNNLHITSCQGDSPLGMNGPIEPIRKSGSSLRLVATTYGEETVSELSNRNL